MDNRNFAFNKPYSEKTAETIDEEVKNLIDQQYARAKSILSKNKKGLRQLAEILLEKEVIFSDDLAVIFGKRPWKSSLDEAPKPKPLPKPSAKKTKQSKDEEATEAKAPKDEEPTEAKALKDEESTGA